MNKARRLSFFITALMLLASLGLGQTDSRTRTERNVRAQMNFLAGDAMQGRGSGTIFERIAAEYVGSQFMQFGLEPAGEADKEGKPTFVQTVTNTRHSFAEAPVLKIGGLMFEHGKDMVLMRTNADKVSGGLQKISQIDKPSTNAAVFVKLPEEFAGNPTQLMQAMITAGASIAMIEETPQLRAAWTSLSARRISFTSTSGSVRPSAMIVLTKESAASVAALPDGAVVEFSGKLSAPELRQTWNAIGKISGSEPSSGVIVLSSHLDHLGLRDGEVGPDKIFNGADDDASGTVAVLELARLLAEEKRPKRTAYFIAYGSEEAGGMGSNHFANNMPFPKESLIANLQFEMIGRPDPNVKVEELWLTGFERSNLGPELAKRGAKLVRDPHPTQNFFQRSDNYTLARQGIIAHTVSSFGLHKDYHRPSDEVRTIDFVHMTRAIEGMVKPIEWLLNSDFRPSWNEGMKP
jgi:aminopeptidase YwaD